VQNTVNFSRFYNPSAERLFEYMYINKFIFQTKDYQLVFVAYNAKQAELRRKSKDWLLRNQDNVERHVYPRTVVSVS
jgi:hypothetical protein